MCLLDEVVEWDSNRVLCRSSSHRGPDHPLRAHGRLGAASGIEYAAQTMAVHGALSASTSASRPEAGFLAALRGVEFRVLRLDDLGGDLLSSAILLAANGVTALYEFELGSGSHTLLRGRATVVFDVDGSVKS
jgi:predicted hotdog family 3-hydroxylacyl-ACP dehydratase